MKKYIHIFLYSTYSAVLVAEADILDLNDRWRDFTAIHEVEWQIL